MLDLFFSKIPFWIEIKGEIVGGKYDRVFVNDHH